jgi:tetraacyldisaccharide 4'-kinase
MDIPAVNGPIAAFCGIARPKQFFAGLEAAGLKLALRQAFPDHHRYTGLDLDRLVAAARDARATAHHNRERPCPPQKLASTFSESMPLLTARLRIEIENQDAAIDWLIGRLGPASSALPCEKIRACRRNPTFACLWSGWAPWATFCTPFRR